MYRAYQYRIYPTSEQKVLLAKSFGCVRWFWNYSLRLCQETYQATGKGLSRGYIQRLLPALSRNPDGKYFASVLVDDGQPHPQVMTADKAIGIDVRLAHFAITSDGSKFDNPTYFAKRQRNLKQKQQKLSRKTKGSQNRKKARLAVAKVHSNVARCREDFLHELSRKIVNENQVIVTENLNVKGVIKNRNLAKAISDVGWGQFCTVVKYKAESGGKTYVEIDRWFPRSKTCHACLHRVGNLALDIRQWTCQHCGTRHNREITAAINTAINIRNENLRILVSQGLAHLSLRTSATAWGGSVSRTGKTSVLLDTIPVESGSPRSIT